MSELPGDGGGDARQRRLDALRKLAAAQPQTPDGASEAPPSAASAQPAPPATGLDQRIGVEAAQAAGGRRRWRVVALGGVAALVVVAVIVGILSRQGGAGALGGQSPATLTPKTYSIGDTTGISCPSTPAWSPDGKQFAVFGQTNSPTDSCMPYNTQLALAQLSGGSAPYQSSNTAHGYALAVFDSATGHVTQRVVLPPLTTNLLCATVPNCLFSMQQGPQSLAWSPDGSSLAVFFTFDLAVGAQARSAQLGGGLLIAQVSNPPAAPRLLLADAPAQAVPGNDLAQVMTVVTAQRFTWNLATGAATASSIPNAAPESQSQDTIPFAPAYTFGADGQLAAASASSASGSSAITPSRVGAVGPRQASGDPILYRTSQWAWSPDGTFVSPNVDTSVFLNTPSSEIGHAGDTYVPPTADAPNAATTAAISASLSSQVGVELALSPDGKLLASYGCAATGAGQLTIRPAKSDTPLAQASYTYPSTVFSLGCVGDIGSLAWSPDGAHIAITDAQDAEVTLWRVNVHS